MSRSIGSYCVLVIMLSSVLTGCSQRRFVVGGRPSNKSVLPRLTDRQAEQGFAQIEAQPPLVDEALADTAQREAVEVIADEPELPRELPLPSDAIAAAAHAATPARLRPARPATIEAPEPKASVAAADTPIEEPAEVKPADDIATHSTARHVAATATAPRKEPAPAPQPDEPQPAPQKRTEREAELDREFAELRALRDSLKKSFLETSLTTTSTARATESRDIDGMLGQIAAQVTQLTKQPVRRPVSTELAVQQPTGQRPSLADQVTQSLRDARNRAPVTQVSHQTEIAVPAPDDLLGVGRYLLNQGLNRDAETALQGAIRLAETEADRMLATYLMGLSQIRQGHRRTAEVSFRNVMQSADAPLAELARLQLQEMNIL